MQSDLQSVLQENLYFQKRKELLSEIEKKLGEKLGKKIAVAAYIANTLNSGLGALTSMSLSQISFIDDLIRTAAEGEETEAVALIVESYGGEATFPTEVINRAKIYTETFYVVVVNVAKSAGTLLALLSDKIVALETASFGPVDPQLSFSTPQGPQSVSARSIRELMETTIPAFTKNLAPAERAAIYASQNFPLYQMSLDALKLVEDVIDKQLSIKLNAEQIKRIKEKLVHVPPSHSINVSIDDLDSLGFPVEKLTVGTEVAQLLLQYHRRALRNLLNEAPPGGQGLLLFENKKTSFQLAGHLQSFAGAVPRQITLPPTTPRVTPPQPPTKPGSEQSPTSSDK